MSNNFELEEKIKAMGDRDLLELVARRVFTLPCQEKSFCPTAVKSDKITIVIPMAAGAGGGLIGAGAFVVAKLLGLV